MKARKLLPVVFLLLLLTACGLKAPASYTQEQMDAIQAERDAVQSQLDAVQAELDIVGQQLAVTRTQITEVKVELDTTRRKLHDTQTELEEELQKSEEEQSALQAEIDRLGGQGAAQTPKTSTAQIGGGQIPVSAPPVPTATAAADFSAYAAEIITLTNQKRTENGLPELIPDEEMMAFAQVRSVEVSTLRGHTRPDGSHIGDYGYGENCAYGQPTPEKAIASWWSSEGHKANILHNYTHIGVGCYRDAGGTWYWVQVFRF